VQSKVLSGGEGFRAVNSGDKLIGEVVVFSCEFYLNSVSYCFYSSSSAGCYGLTNGSSFS